MLALSKVQAEAIFSWKSRHYGQCGPEVMRCSIERLLPYDTYTCRQVNTCAFMVRQSQLRGEEGQ